MHLFDMRRFGVRQVAVKDDTFERSGYPCDALHLLDKCLPLLAATRLRPADQLVDCFGILNQWLSFRF